MSQPRTPQAGDRLQRTRFYPGQVVSPPDLAQDCEYLLHRLRRHDRLLHGWGIKRGLKFEMVPVKGAEGSPERLKYDKLVRDWGELPPDVKPGEGAWIVVLPGYAVTPVGDEIYLPAPVFLRLTEELDGALVTSPAECRSNTNPRKVEGRNGIWRLVVDAFESELVPVRAPGSRCGDHAEHFENSRLKDTLRFRLLEKKPDKSEPPFGEPPDESKLLTGKPDRCYISLGIIAFPAGSAPRAPADDRNPDRDRDPWTPSSDSPPAATPAPQADADVLDQLLAGGLPAAEVALKANERKLLKGLELCLDVDGQNCLFRGWPRAEALKHVPARSLNYGGLQGTLNWFFDRWPMSVASLLKDHRLPKLITYFMTQGDEHVQFALLLQSALQAAAVTSHLVHQWPSSRLKRPV